MNAQEIWEKIKNTCIEQDEKCVSYFEKVQPISFDEESHTLTLLAQDGLISTLLQNHYGQSIISALENIVGHQAFVDCQFNYISHKHPNFNTTIIEEGEIIGQQSGRKSVIQQMSDDITELRKRIEKLESQKT